MKTVEHLAMRQSHTTPEEVAARRAERTANAFHTSQPARRRMMAHLRNRTKDAINPPWWELLELECLTAHDQRMQADPEYRRRSINNDR